MTISYHHRVAALSFDPCSCALRYVMVLLSESRADRRLKGERHRHKICFCWQSLHHGSNHRMYNQSGEAFATARPQNYVDVINSFDYWCVSEPACCPLYTKLCEQASPPASLQFSGTEINCCAANQA